MKSSFAVLASGCPRATAGEVYAALAASLRVVILAAVPTILAYLVVAFGLFARTLKQEGMAAL